MSVRGVVKKDKRPTNPLIAGIQQFILQRTPPVLNDTQTYGGNATETRGLPLTEQNGTVLESRPLLDSDLPKRYMLYEPMLLLGPTFPSHSPAWRVFYNSLELNELLQLFKVITEAFCQSGHHVTHVALNAPIQMNIETELGQQDNLMRSPSSLQPLFGDFGPVVCAATTSLTRSELDEAFWVETSQVSGIKQVWAPRWTMFSRGNIREKSRILGQQGTFSGLSEAELGQPLSNVDVVDFFVGIGYFAFSYLKRGVRRVFGWDLNTWSIEGLRRGCERNGWRCLVVTVDADVDKHAAIVEQVVGALESPEPPRCVAFCGDNAFAARIMKSVSKWTAGTNHALRIRHCNLGLLPTSQVAWNDAVRVLSETSGGWLHVHENAEISQVTEKEQAVLIEIQELTRQVRGDTWQVCCEGIEMVKTYAPGVGHYVFDIKLWPAR